MTMDKSIGSASVRVSKKLTRIMNHFLKPYYITTEQWSVLRTLDEENPITQKELSIRSDKDQATLTKILDLVEKREYIKRVPNPSDRRSFLIEITDKGIELVQQLTPYINDVFEKVVYGIQEEKIEIYQEILLQLESNIEKLLEKEKEGE